MNLDDKLKELKEEVPKVDSSLEEKIFVRSKQKKTGRNPIFNKLTLSICGIVLVVLILIIGPITFRGTKNDPFQNGPDESIIKLLHTVDEPTEYIMPASTQNQFYEGLRLFSGKVAKLCLDGLKPEENAVMSPASIFSALALVAECTDGKTRQEILNAIGMEYEVLEQNYARFYQSLNQIEKGTNKTKGKLTNTIWLDKVFPYKEDCISDLASKYFCYSHGVDFNQIEYVNKYISDFISKQTNGLLKPELNLSPETVLVLLNTLYLRDAWNDTAKDLPLTQEEYKFKNTDGMILSKQFLRGEYNSGRMFRNEAYKQFYTKTNEYTITFIVPQNGNKIEDVFTSEVISNARKTSYVFSSNFEGDEPREVYYTRCIFPEFSASSELNLKEIFESLGITDMFTPAANFSKITPEDLICNYAKHFAKLDVNKKGIEGAAATIIGVEALSPAPEIVKEIYEDFIVDESFGFVISNGMGANLFSGIIRNI
ncbi:MAG: serpin family protein [Roseburia sp.]|nr:serpin family protein [Anaeroplasma bactoclasticum]MCM1197162.1 serpin family protein [Roseburia sp.]MCM1557617.1 serpin family protein [Anaeroplasma bactoclasticum]